MIGINCALLWWDRAAIVLVNRVVPLRPLHEFAQMSLHAPRFSPLGKVPVNTRVVKAENYDLPREPPNRP